MTSFIRFTVLALIFALVPLVQTVYVPANGVAFSFVASAMADDEEAADKADEAKEDEDEGEGEGTAEEGEEGEESEGTAAEAGAAKKETQSSSWWPF
jgi:hypothetical protein